MSRVYLLLCLAALLSVSYSRRRPFRSIKAPAETVENYSIVIPEIIHTEGDGPYPKFLDVVIATEDLHYTLLLELNDVLIPPGFTSHSFDDSGKIVVTKGQVNCYYQGTVKERPEWQAIISLCHGVQGTFGMHGFEEAQQQNLYHIEPLSRDNTKLSQPHAVYLDSEYEITNGTCGSHHTHDDHISIHMNNSLSHEDLAKLREQRQSGQQFLFVELVMVNDRRQYLSFSSNLENTVRRALDIANHMDTLFRVLNVRIALVEVITWTTSDQISVVSNAEALLNNFRGYVSQVSTRHDALMLLTAIDLAGSTIGIAFTSTTCSSSAVGVTQDQGRSVASTGATASHELGHIMNMGHDDSPGCACPDGNSMCIMAATITFNPPDRWSQCSRDDLLSGFTGPRNLDRCLFNEPTSVVGDPTCGNGIMEEGEACDCGSLEECTNPCCNANTCQLAAGAVCSTGTCCNTATCQLRPYGTTCRLSSGDCDIAEFCQGDSESCPVDTFRRDGSTCNSGNDYCFDGTCETYNSQCQFHFRTNKGDDRCYTNYNTRGDQFGNCGYDNSNFLACASSDVNCGMLFCRPDGSYQSTANVVVTIVTVGVTRTIECEGFTPQPGADVLNPGLVNDGTRCGNGLACYQQECISVNNLPSVAGLPSCPVGNGQQCSGNGQCNQLGGCSCNVGFTGSNCGSTTSGPGVGPVNECASNNGGCAQICTDTTDSFTCSCNTGFTLDSDGRSCNDINECTANTDGCAQTCTNTQGSFRCSCNNGYRLAPDGRGCNDLNECATSNGGCSQTCTNSVGSFECSCRAGFTLATNGRTCNDINECAVNNGGCSQICTNTDGSFVCSCPSGFALAANGRSCVDVDECGNNNGGCSQLCVNEEPGFSCDCMENFELDNDERTCKPSFPCEVDNNCEQDCDGSSGVPVCSCRSGYVLAEDMEKCNDDNECADENGGCSDTCINREGSFTCGCPDGQELAADFRNCRLSNSSGSVSGSGGSGSSNVSAIAGGVVGALIAVVLVIALVVVIVFFVYKKNSRSSAHKTTKYSRPNGDLGSTSSRQNLFTTTSETSLPSVQFRGQENVTYSGYKPPAPLYTGGIPPASSNETRRAPPQPPVSQVSTPLSQPPARRAAPLPPPAKRPAPVSPPATAPPLKPPAPVRPKPPTSAPTRPLLPTKPPMQPPPTHSSNIYTPPVTFKPPPPANKPVLQPRPPPTSQKPSPAARPPVASKPSPAPKPTAPPPSRANIQWPPPSHNSTSSAAPTSSKRPMVPPSKKPMVPPKK